MSAPAGFEGYWPLPQVDDAEGYWPCPPAVAADEAEDQRDAPAGRAVS